ncbi:RHS repeat-associated core domain-containing protein [Pseudomonas fluorescens]|uniref:RHS repeat-associated core domain-containing protein n=1 Tax=Pseudomonas fluorescens TaxID=294 RepID=A0A5E7G0R5_PSEFL|nr:RHS repeat-associated core domain-containing protein [Pseudomonas fluorescens]VVO42753.1 hypothetical protein PS710_06084 [Pseudomonas fluorescens]
MLAGDVSGSILNEVGEGGANRISYTAYGHRGAEQPVSTQLGYNGEVKEGQTGCYLLGNGYRAYSPGLMRFHSPDSLSPFGEGGVNAYAYCEGDSINNLDLTGHGVFSWLKQLLMPHSTNLQRTQHRASVASVSGGPARDKGSPVVMLVKDKTTVNPAFVESSSPTSTITKAFEFLDNENSSIRLIPAAPRASGSSPVASNLQRQDVSQRPRLPLPNEIKDPLKVKRQVKPREIKEDQQAIRDKDWKKRREQKLLSRDKFAF